MCYARYHKALDRLSMLPPLTDDKWLYVKNFFDVATFEMMDTDLAIQTTLYRRAVEILRLQYTSGREPPGANFLREHRM